MKAFHHMVNDQSHSTAKKKKPSDLSRDPNGSLCD